MSQHKFGKLLQIMPAIMKLCDAARGAVRNFWSFGRYHFDISRYLPSIEKLFEYSS